jgi:hypothetical protein
MLNEENVVQATEEEVTVQEEAVATEEVAPVEETAVAEETVFEEVSEDIAVIQRHNEAVAYLRRKDCEMLTTLRDHLGENIRLHNILARINAEIDRLKALLKTPKPKTKVFLIIFAISLTAPSSITLRTITVTVQAKSSSVSRYSLASESIRPIETRGRVSTSAAMPAFQPRLSALMQAARKKGMTEGR